MSEQFGRNFVAPLRPSFGGHEPVAHEAAHRIEKDFERLGVDGHG